MLTAVLFDFDGTLVDTTELIYQSLRHASNEVLGHEPPREVLMANVGRPMPVQMAALVEKEYGGQEETDAVANEMLDSYMLHSGEHHEALIRKFPDVEKSLARLKEADVKIAVVTSKRRPSVKMAIKIFPELGRVTDHFVTMEDTEEHKPKPAPLLKGLELLGDVPLAEAAYVGDSPHDVEAARAAGVESVGVSWGAFTEESLQAANPDHLVGDLDAAVDVLIRDREIG